MSRLPPRRIALLATARKHPEFALKVAHALDADTRERFVSTLAKPERAEKPRLPGLAKCARSPFAPENGLTAQLSLFARSAARVR
jgi:hypothetical protein